jgi:VIT1/CCC1 family predicted Fe2+/Mn2+ transporter
VSNHIILLTGLAGLLAGALSMGAGEYVSVRSQRELLEASIPDPDAHQAVSQLDAGANELTLLYRAQGMSAADAAARAGRVLAGTESHLDDDSDMSTHDEHEAVGTGLGAAISSFCFFATGAVIPVMPYLFGLQGIAAVAVATVLVGIALLFTGGVVGLLSGGSPVRRALRQLMIGYGAAAVTYLLGLLFGAGA